MKRESVFNHLLEVLEKLEMENLENLLRIAAQEDIIRTLQGEKMALTHKSDLLLYKIKKLEKSEECEICDEAFAASITV